MTVTTNIQLNGYHTTKAEVSATGRALSSNLRPIDNLGVAGGCYQSGVSANMQHSTIAWAAGSVCFAFRWTSIATVARIKAVTFSDMQADGGTPRVITYSLIRAAGFEQQYKQQADQIFSPANLIFSPLNAKQAAPSHVPPMPGGVDTAGTTFDGNLVGDFVYWSAQGAPAATTGLVGATVTLDTQPMASMCAGSSATAGNPTFVGTQNLFKAGWGDEPLVLTAFTGFVITRTVGAAAGASNPMQTSFNVNFEQIPIFGHEEFQ